MDFSTYGNTGYASKRTRPNDDDYTPPPLPVAYQQALAKTPNTAPAPAPKPLAPTKPGPCHGVAPAKGRDEAGPPEAPTPSHTPDPQPEISADQVLALLRKHQLMSARDIALQLKAGTARIGQLLADLHRQGLAHRGPRGRWACAPARQRAAEVREAIVQACQGRIRITAPIIHAQIGGNTKTIANRLAELAEEGVIVRTSAGVYRDPATRPADYAPTPEPDLMALKKSETVRAILRRAARPMTAPEIWQQEPELFGGTDSTRVNAILLDQLQRGRVARYLPDGERAFRWYIPGVSDPEGAAEATACHGEARAEGADEAGPDPILSTIEQARPQPPGLPPLRDHATECRRLRGLADKDVLDPIISAWLRDLANQIETQHRSAGDARV